MREAGTPSEQLADAAWASYSRALFGSNAFGLGGFGAAQAQFNQSEYTDMDLDQCTVIQSDDFGSTWACPGLKGLPVMVRESERRFRISYGLTSTTEQAADHHSGLSAINLPVVV